MVWRRAASKNVVDLRWAIGFVCLRLSELACKRLACTHQIRVAQHTSAAIVQVHHHGFASQGFGAFEFLPCDSCRCVLAMSGARHWQRHSSPQLGGPRMDARCPHCNGRPCPLSIGLPARARPSWLQQLRGDTCLCVSCSALPGPSVGAPAPGVAANPRAPSQRLAAKEVCLLRRGCLPPKAHAPRAHGPQCSLSAAVPSELGRPHPAAPLSAPMWTEASDSGCRPSVQPIQGEALTDSLYAPAAIVRDRSLRRRVLAVRSAAGGCRSAARGGLLASRRPVVGDDVAGGRRGATKAIERVSEWRVSALYAAAHDNATTNSTRCSPPSPPRFSCRVRLVLFRTCRWSLAVLLEGAAPMCVRRLASRPRLARGVSTKQQCRRAARSRICRDAGRLSPRGMPFGACIASRERFRLRPRLRPQRLELRRSFLLPLALLVHAFGWTHGCRASPASLLDASRMKGCRRHVVGRELKVRGQGTA